jgi:lactose/L-arabinose transport system permease protein
MIGRKIKIEQRRNLTGWIFLCPATALILFMSFYPMLQSFLMSLETGAGSNMKFTGFSNYLRILKDGTFLTTLGNTLIYLIIQVPLMLLLALAIASLLNNTHLRFRNFFRAMIFLPCTTSLVAYSLVFHALFIKDGFVNEILTGIGLNAINWFANAWSARLVIILGLLWRWTGLNVLWYQSALQNIDYSVYEAARIDGASPVQVFFKITIPLLKPTIIVTAISSISGTLQLYDESVNLTFGGPAQSSMSMAHYVYNTAFVTTPNLGYASALAVVIMLLIASLTMLQMKVGDKRD